MRKNLTLAFFALFCALTAAAQLHNDDVHVHEAVSRQNYRQYLRIPDIGGHITLWGCPKLDDVDYSEKLTQIIRENNIQSVTVVRMEVPCCGGLERAAKVALQNSGKFIPWQVITISIDGNILSEL